MTTVSNIVAPTWWNLYAAPAYDEAGAEARKREEKLYRAEVPGAPDTANYHGYVYAKNGLLRNADGPVEVPSKALYLKHEDGSYFTLDFGDDAKVSLIDKSRNLELYVYVSEGSAERYEFDKGTGNMVGDSPTELNALEVSAIEKKSKVVARVQKCKIYGDNCGLAHIRLIQVTSGLSSVFSEQSRG